MSETASNKHFRNPSGKGKILLYVFFTVVIVALFFIALEFIARMAASHGLVNPERPDDRVAYSDNPFKKVIIDGVEYYESASEWMVKSRFLVKKPRRIYRIFILGESFAMGSPYVTQTSVNGKGSMDSWIRAELEVVGLDKRFEIINAAAGSMNSFSVKNYAKAACDSGADLIIIATGNNEGFLPPSEFNLVLNKLTSYRLLKEALLREPELLERPLTGRKDESPEMVSAAFKKNLEEIISYAKEKNVAVALATLPINLSGVCIVYRSRVSKEYEKALQLRREGRFQEALDLLWQCPDSGAKYFQMGKCLEGLGKLEEAFHAYTTALFIDPGNRMMPSHNDMLKDLVKEHNIILIDLESRIRAMSKNGIPGTEQFVDYCHLRWKYYAACADEITLTLQNLEIMPTKKVPWSNFDEKLEMLLKQMKVNEPYLSSLELRTPLFYSAEDDYWVHQAPE